MAFLVGDNATRTATHSSNNSDELQFACGGHSASTTGTATTAYIRISNVYSTTAVKVIVYSAAGSRLATATISSPATGWNSAALDSSVSIVSGTTYILGFIATPSNQYLNVYCDDTTWNTAGDTSGDYTTPPASITPADEGSGSWGVGKPSIYLDGSTGGGATFPVPALGLKRHQLTAKRLGLFS